MKYTHLGNSGLVVSRIALGCMNYGSKRWRPWMLEEDEARENFAYAIEHGINFFDTSNIYSMGVSEQIVGRWVRELARREQVVIATKVGLPLGEGPNREGAGRKHLIDSCEASLRRLNTDYIDLYQIHRPIWKLRLRKRSRRSTAWSVRARSATPAPAAWRRGSFQRRCIRRGRTGGIARSRCKAISTWSIGRKSAR